MAQFDFGPNIFAPVEQSFEDWLKYSYGRESANRAAALTGYGQGIGQFATQQTGMATQAANRAREEALLAKTMEAMGPDEGALPEGADLYSPQNVGRRAKLAAGELTTDRNYLEAQKAAGIANSEALAAQRNEQTSLLKRAQETRERLQNAEANLKELQALGDVPISKLQAAQLAAQQARAAHVDAVQASAISWQPAAGPNGEPGRVAVPRNSPAGTFIEGPGPAAAQDRELKSGAAIKAGDRIINQLSDPAFSDLVGPALGRANSFEDAVGTAPPEFGRLLGEIRGLSQVLGSGIHGIRAQRAGEHMEELLSTSKDPNLLIATLQGALSIARDFDASRVQRGARSGFAASGASPVAPGPGVGGGTPTISSESEYNALPSGTVFIGPDGVRRTKP